MICHNGYDAKYRPHFAPFCSTILYPITNKPFVCDHVNQLRRHLSTDLNEIWQVGPDWVKERFYIIFFRKFQMVAMEMWKCGLSVPIWA